MNPETCPMLYTCSRVAMTPLIRALLRCTAAEAMEFICANCEEWQQGHNQHNPVAAESAKERTHVSASGRKTTVTTGKGSRLGDTSHRSGRL